VKEIATYHNVQLNFGFGGLGGTTSAHSAPTNAGGNNPSLFNVPIVNANGEAGSIQVVASDASAALSNATQGGNTPTGKAIPA
jgi:hypothetical protein